MSGPSSLKLVEPGCAEGAGPCRNHAVIIQRVREQVPIRPPDGFDSPCSLTLAGRLNQLVEGKALAGRLNQLVEGRAPAGRLNQLVEGKCAPTDRSRGDVRDGSAARPGTFRGRFEHAVTLEA